MSRIHRWEGLGVVLAGAVLSGSTTGCTRADSDSLGSRQDAGLDAGLDGSGDAGQSCIPSCGAGHDCMDGECVPREPDAGPVTVERRVVWVGNSYTELQDPARPVNIPEAVSAVLEERETYSHEASATPGTWLVDHLEGGSQEITDEVLSRCEFDVLVLQESSQGQLDPGSLEFYEDGAVGLSERARELCGNVRVILYQTPPFPARSSDDCAADEDIMHAAALSVAAQVDQAIEPLAPTLVAGGAAEFCTEPYDPTLLYHLVAGAIDQHPNEAGQARIARSLHDAIFGL